MAKSAPTTAIPINGPALREIRIRTGVSVAGLAAEVGIGRPYLTKIELGTSKRVSEQVFDSIVNALRITDKRALMGPAA